MMPSPSPIGTDMSEQKTAQDACGRCLSCENPRQSPEKTTPTLAGQHFFDSSEFIYQDEQWNEELKIMAQEPENPDPGVADYFERHGPDVGSMLIARAPDVIILAKLKGAPATARYFSEIIRANITEKQIKGIKLKVKTGRLRVTEEELIKAAQSHPASAARLARDPSLAMIDPKHPTTKVAATGIPTAEIKEVAEVHFTNPAPPPPFAAENASAVQPLDHRPVDHARSASPSATLSAEQEREALARFDAADEAGE
jgi:hypothetical protein